MRQKLEDMRGLAGTPTKLSSVDYIASIEQSPASLWL